MQVKPTLPRGTRDFLPDEMLKRQSVFEKVKCVFEKYGFLPLETPSIEKLSVLSGKYGEEGEKLIFKVLRRGTGLEELLSDRSEFTVKKYDELVEEALRYDLTVPLSRVVAMYQDKITLPFKRYQIQPVWRADKPQRGRYREFYQCDIDTVGTDSVLADAEVIAVINDVLDSLGFKKYKIRINNRKILNGIISYSQVPEELGVSTLITIDKLDKIGLDGVKGELERKGIDSHSISKILNILEISGEPSQVLSEIIKALPDNEFIREGVFELQQILSNLPELGVPTSRCKLDLYLARGLGYYTGPIYETIVEEHKIGSLSGGGRYDHLIGMFLGRDIPATGTSFGIERIIDVMTQLDMLPSSKGGTEVLLTLFEESTMKDSLSFATELRNVGINTETFPAITKFKKQMAYADKKGIPFVAIIGPDEVARGKVSIKDMKSGNQQTLDMEEAKRFLLAQKEE